MNDLHTLQKKLQFKSSHRGSKEMDILTVGIVTMPFHFEGKLRLEQAELGLENIKKKC